MTLSQHLAIAAMAIITAVPVAVMVWVCRGDGLGGVGWMGRV